MDEANLGLATTRELLEELRARAHTNDFGEDYIEVRYKKTLDYFLMVLTDKTLNYRTVDGG